MWCPKRCRHWCPNVKPKYGLGLEGYCRNSPMSPIPLRYFYPLWYPVKQCSRFISRDSKKSHYDILEISPSATQAQVKKAYYELSKTFHPDQYRGEEDPAVKFREITEAYEVLGNFQSRRMYDKGILNVVAATPEEAEEYSAKFYNSRSKRGKMPSTTGRTPIFNFDEWSKLHYESSFERRRHAKIRYEEMKRTEHEIAEEKKSRAAMIIILFMGVGVLFQATFKSVDKPRLPKTSKS